MKKKKLDFTKLQSLNDELYHGKEKLSDEDLKSLLGGTYEPTYSSIKTYNSETEVWSWDTGVADDSPPGTFYT